MLADGTTETSSQYAAATNARQRVMGKVDCHGQNLAVVSSQFSTDALAVYFSFLSLFQAISNAKNLISRHLPPSLELAENTPGLMQMPTCSLVA